MATDQEIRDKGILYLPKQEYLQDPYQFSVAPVPDGGITNTNAFNNSGGNDFSVYNPDPNSIVNRNYNPRPNYDAYYEDTFGANLGDPEALTATGARFAEPNTKMSGILNMMPGAGIARFLGNQIGPYMPTNRRAIMENQLSGQGIMVNDIGQIVQGDGAYDDISGRNVMAGYNANKMTAKTFDKRIKEATLKMDDDGPYKQKRLDALKAAKADFLRTQKKADKIFDFEEEEKKKKKKDTVVGRYLDKRDRVALAEQQTNPEGPSNAPGGTPGGSPNNFTLDDKMTYDNSRGDFKNADGSNVNQNFNTTASVSNYDPSVLYADGGRVGYFFGGRARLQGGGGADMGAPEKAAERASKGYGTAPDTGSKSGTNDYSTTTQTQNNDRSIRDNQNPVPKESILNKTMDLGSELSYLNNLKNLNVLGIVGNIGVNKFRNYLDNRKTTEEDDKFSYNTNPLPTNNYTTKLVGPALAQMRSLEKAKGMEQFGGSFSTEQEQGLNKLKQMDQEKTIYSQPIFVGANGGRAMFKNGGLASLL